MAQVAMDISIRRDHIIKKHVGKLESNGWMIGQAVQRMLEGERREFPLVSCK
jgi:hypothetical protein